jgi:hypothetical protein
VAIGNEHLPEDPKVLQKMVLDLTAQLDRESAERHKVETILRELIEARRSRKSEQLSADQLALFAAVWRPNLRRRAVDKLGGQLFGLRGQLQSRLGCISRAA